MLDLEVAKNLFPGTFLRGSDVVGSKCVFKYSRLIVSRMAISFIVQIRVLQSERGHFYNYATTTGINWDCPRQTSDYPIYQVSLEKQMNQYLSNSPTGHRTN